MEFIELLSNKKQRIMNKLVQIILVLAAIVVIVGIVLIFQIDPEKRLDSTLIASIFSLSSVFVFAAALYYQAASLKKQTEAVEKQGHALDVQIKEFQLQQVELKKSVEAQTNTSKALEEQRKIMLEQKANEFLLGITNQFVNYSNAEPRVQIVKNYFDSLSRYVFSICEFGRFLEEKDEKKSIPQFIGLVKNHVISYTCKNDISYLWGFAVKIIRVIEKNEREVGLPKFFVSHTINQLNPIIIHLFTLGELTNIVPRNKEDNFHFRDQVAIRHMVESLINANENSKQLLIRQLYDFFQNT